MGVSRRCRFSSATGPQSTLLDADLALYETLSALVCEKTSVLAGDFNCSGVDWETDLAIGERLRLLDFKHDNFLSQKVREPTRGANVLDLIFNLRCGSW